MVSKEAMLREIREYLKNQRQHKTTLRHARRYHRTEKGREAVKRANKKYNLSEKGKEAQRKYRQSEEGKEAQRKRNKKRLQSKEGKIARAKINAKRRGLGAIRLNEPFEGGAWHHVDKKHVVCIPEESHKSVWHNLWTGQGMSKINAIAFAYLFSHSTTRHIA